MTARRWRERTTGQNLVEFALVGPIFFLMLLGTVEMGRLMWVNHEVSAGTREGARWASVRGERSGENISNDDVHAIIIERSNALNGDALLVNVTWSDPDRSPGSTVTVATTYTYTPLISGFLGLGDITMSRQSQLTVHY